jgi:fumarate hydratase subunit beta
MIGKGKRGKDVKDAMHKHKAIYLAAIGGAGALIAKSIRSAKIIAYPDIGTEAIRELVVENMPLIVANDIYGGDLYEEGLKKYKMS